MPRISFLRPIDQPTGRKRLLNEIIDCLKASDFSSFLLAVGFAKSGPLLRLSHLLQEWRISNKTVQGIIGINHLGTSRQALELALRMFNEVFVTFIPQGIPLANQVTFHPKLYIFYGDRRAVCFYGSHNFTVGGIETNFEGGVKVEFDRAVDDDERSFREALDCWSSLLPDQCPATQRLDAALFDQYLREGLLLDESRSRSRRIQSPAGSRPAETPSQLLVTLARILKPPSSIPKEVLPVFVQAPEPEIVSTIRTTSPPVASGQTLVIQIIPHHNGEVFLSKTAANQNPEFFDFPFTGRTVPKKPTNPSYPQRIPDPVVNITVCDDKGIPISSLGRRLFNLNMVYYAPKSEIRITVNPELARAIPKYSILIMSKNQTSDPQDYDMEICFPGSQQFNDYLAVCNQVLPSGGAEKSRKMGWL